MDIRFQERTLEVINFMNLAVRTQKPKTFEMLNHHEPNVALDVAQAFTRSNAGRRFWSLRMKFEEE